MRNATGFPRTSMVMIIFLSATGSRISGIRSETLRAVGRVTGRVNCGSGSFSTGEEGA